MVARGQCDGHKAVVMQLWERTSTGTRDLQTVIC